MSCVALSLRLRYLGILTSIAIAMPLLCAAGANAQTVNGNAFVLRSNGSATGTNWNLTSNGYLGTYVQVPAAGGQVTFTINADGAQSNTVWPDMTLSVAGENTSFAVNSTTPGTYTATVNLPGDPAANANGTYAVRLQLDNQNGTATPDLTVNNMTISGATVVNSNTSTLAMDASQTYIDKFRQGWMSLNVIGAPAGTPVQVKLVSNNFSLGSAVYDNSEPNNFFNTHDWLTATASSTGTQALAYDYQQFLLKNFTTIEPENAGKWSSDEATQGHVNMSMADQISNFAESHDLNVRMHNLVAESQQPTFINTDFTNNNVSAINAAVTSRVAYYDTANNTQAGPADNKPRALAYQQMDVLNEGLHAGTGQPNYIGTLGYSGVASIYSQVANAVASVGANTELYTNEYNVLQNSADAYSNWYLNEIQSINSAAGSKVVSGVGSELYATTAQLVPSTMQQTLQNLSVTGLPLTLTEFGIATGTNAATAATDLQDAFTMIYGDPNATTFDVWDFWSTLEANDTFLQGYEAGALMDANGNPTALYNTLATMLNGDNYVLPGNITAQNLFLGANGQLNFNGTYGEYEVTVDGQNFFYDYTPTGTSLVVAVPEPASAALFAIASAGLLIRKRRRA